LELGEGENTEIDSDMIEFYLSWTTRFQNQIVDVDCRIFELKEEKKELILKAVTWGQRVGPK